MFTQKFQAWVRKWAERLVSVFRDSPLTPNMLTLFGLVITGAGAAALALVYLGLLVFFLGQHQTVQPVLILLALAGSFLVSYVRARAQSLGFTCEVGILARPERVVIIVAGLLLDGIVGHHVVLTLALVILAVGTNFTAVQRIWVVWQQNRAMLRAQRRRPLPAGADEAGAATPTRPAKRRFFETP